MHNAQRRFFIPPTPPVKMHKDPGALLAITSKNNNTPLSNCNLCIKILPERWSVPKSHSSGNRPQSRQPESLFAPHEKGERFLS